MSRYWLLAAFAVIVLILLALAWADGGRQPVRLIVEPVPVPEMPK